MDQLTSVNRRPIDLALSAPFPLGNVRVDPPAHEVCAGTHCIHVQPQPLKVLVTLADRRGDVVSRDEIVERCWDGRIVGDDVLNRAILLLRGVSRELGGFDIETIPKTGYRLRERSLKRPDGPSRPLGAWVAVALLVLTLLGGWLAFGSGRVRHPPRNVSVHLFQVLGDSGELRVLDQQIANEIVNELGDSQVEAILSAQSGDDERVGLIVAGMLHEVNGETRADVRIEDGASRATLWSASFSGRSRETTDLPVEVAARVTDIVNIANFARDAEPSFTDAASLSALLQTSDKIREAGDGNWAPMIVRAQALVASHPGFAFAHSLLASAYSEAAKNADTVERARQMRTNARREVAMTLSLDPEDAGAFAAWDGIIARNDYRQREEILLRGIRQARHPKEALGALYSYEGTLLGDVGRLRSALTYQQMAQALDPWGPPKTAKLALAYANLGDVETARRWIDTGYRRWPDHAAIRAVRRQIMAFHQPPEKAIASIESLGERSGFDKQALDIWLTFLRARQHQAAPEIKRATQTIVDAESRKLISTDDAILMLASLRRPGPAIDLANRALERGALQPRFLLAPVARDVLDDPAFIPLARRLGLLDYWRATGLRPDICDGSAHSGPCPTSLGDALDQKHPEPPTEKAPTMFRSKPAPVPAVRPRAV